MRNDCAMAPIAGEYGGAIIERGVEAEQAFGYLVTDFTIEDRVRNLDELRVRTNEIAETAYLEIGELKRTFPLFLQDVADITIEFLGDIRDLTREQERDRAEGKLVRPMVIDAQGYTRARSKMIDLLKTKYPLVDRMSPYTHQYIAGVLALERLGLTGHCGAIEVWERETAEIDT